MKNLKYMLTLLWIQIMKLQRNKIRKLKEVVSISQEVLSQGKMVILHLQVKEMVEMLYSEIQKQTGNLTETHGPNQVLIWNRPLHGDLHLLHKVKALVIQVNLRVQTFVHTQLEWKLQHTMLHKGHLVSHQKL
uniref:Uncharacterized protein n=1 Tax=Arundo donax TaxID=35708 RepID=A0A0A9CKS3_ARUDO